MGVRLRPRLGVSRGYWKEARSPQGCIKLDLANATKAPWRIDGDPAVVVLVLVVVIVIENPGEKTDYEDEDDDEDESGKAQNRPAINAQ